MNRLIQDCIARIRDKSENRGADGYDVQAPGNPSMIVNYNLDSERLTSYYAYLKQLWPGVYSNIPRADRESDFETLENQVRSNSLYVNFNEIHIHVLVDLTGADLGELRDFLQAEFDLPSYKLILHEFLDYEHRDQIEDSEEKLLSLMRGRGGIRYQFIYSNRLYNGAMWLGESAAKIIRLAANITAIMSIDSHYFNDDKAYTFSYNLLEKPTRRIVQFTLRRFLENACSCPERAELNQEISKKYRACIQREAAHSIGSFLFRPDDFQYLPDNEKLQREKANIKKSMESLERAYPTAALCFQAMIGQKIAALDGSRGRKADFSEALSDPLLMFDAIEGFLKTKNPKGENRGRKELLESLEGVLLSQRTADEGSYSQFLTEYGNQALEREAIKRIYKDFSVQFMIRAEHATAVYRWLRESLDSPELQLQVGENEENLAGYYGRLVDTYFASHREDIIGVLNSCSDKEELRRKGLYSQLVQMFDSIPIYYKSFEDEIDERVGNDTARKMFERISEEDSVARNICIDWTNLGFHLNRVRTGEVLLLIHPESKLLTVEIADNYEVLSLNRQDCVERIDFHTLGLRPEVES